MAFFSRSNRFQLEASAVRRMPAGKSGTRVFDSSSCEDDTLLDAPAAISVPAYSSKPDAPATLFLDLNGHKDTARGNGQPGETYDKLPTPTLDLTKETSQEVFGSSVELRVINEIWKTFAEYFASFNVNVTTVNPGDFSNGKVLRLAIGGLYQEMYRSMLQYR